MLKLSLNSRRAYGRLHARYNDCDVYVEDPTMVGIHEKVINAGLAGKGSVSRVIPLGGRNEVLQAAMKDTTQSGRPRLYVIDGDLEFIWRRRRRSAPHLYVLNLYEFENLLATEDRLEEVAAASLTKLSKAAALAAVNLPGLLREIEALRPYLLLLALAQKLGLGGSVFALNPPSVSRRERNVYVGVDNLKVHSRCLAIARTICAKVGYTKFLKEYQIVKGNLIAKNPPAPLFVPGKKFLLYYFKNRLAVQGGTGHSDTSVCGFLAMKIDFANERQYRSRLRRLL